MEADGAEYGDTPLAETDFNETGEAEWISETFATDRGALEASLGHRIVECASTTIGRRRRANAQDFAEGAGLSANSWSGSPALALDGDQANLEAYIAAEMSLRDHLAAQLRLATVDPVDRLIGQSLIDSIDDAGYFTDTPAEIAAGSARRSKEPKRFLPSSRALSLRASARAISPNVSPFNCAKGTVSIPRCRRWSRISISSPSATTRIAQAL